MRGWNHEKPGQSRARQARGNARRARGHTGASGSGLGCGGRRFMDWCPRTPRRRVRIRKSGRAGRKSRRAPPVGEGGGSGEVPDSETLLRELNHRVKNNFQIIVSLMNLRKRMLPAGRREDIRFIEEHVQSMSVPYRLVYATGSMVD